MDPSQIDNMSPAFSFSIVLLQSFSVLLSFLTNCRARMWFVKASDRAIMCLRVTPVSPHCLAPSSVSPHPVLVLDPALMRLVSPPCSNHRLPAMFRLCYIYVFLNIRCKHYESLLQGNPIYQLSSYSLAYAHFPICLPTDNSAFIFILFTFWLLFPELLLVICC